MSNNKKTVNSGLCTLYVATLLNNCFAKKFADYNSEKFPGYCAVYKLWYIALRCGAQFRTSHVKPPNETFHGWHEHRKPRKKISYSFRTWTLSKLKGLCKDDVAVFAQFCAKSLLSSYQFLYPYIKCCCRVKNKISNQFKHFGDLSRHRIKTWKRWANVFKFQSLPSVTTDDRKQRQCLTIVFNNKTRSLFWEFNRYGRRFCFFP